jgi:ubiquinone biosynthesis protein
MNWFGFLRLLRMIYGKKKVDVKKIEEMGLLAVKIGQVHALRIDFLDSETCTQLSKLYDAVTPIDEEEVLQRIDPKIRQQLKNLSKKPIASASIGQVHTAEYNGEQVAVKIVKADFKERFIKEVKGVRAFAKFVVFFYPKLKKVFNPIGVLHHIEEYTLNELNMHNEIEGQETLKKIHQENKTRVDLERLKFPKVYKEISDENVLVFEFVKGKTFDQLLDDGELDYEDLLELFKIHGFFIFGVGTFHGDIHPGNIMYHDDDIYFIDTGAISTVSKKISTNLLDFFDCLGQYDYKQAATYLNKMAKKQLTGEQYNRFENKFLELYGDFTDKTVAEISLTKKMMQTIKLGVNSGMEFEKGMFGIIKSLMFLDGMVMRCNPNAKLLKDMRKFIPALRGEKS